MKWTRYLGCTCKYTCWPSLPRIQNCGNNICFFIRTPLLREFYCNAASSSLHLKNIRYYIKIQKFTVDNSLFGPNMSPVCYAMADVANVESIFANFMNI